MTPLFVCGEVNGWGTLALDCRSSDVGRNETLYTAYLRGRMNPVFDPARHILKTNVVFADGHAGAMSFGGGLDDAWLTKGFTR